MTQYKELAGEKREKFKKWLKLFQKENDRSPTIEEVYDEATKELDKKLSQAEADYDKMFFQKNEIISNLQEQIEKMKCCENCAFQLVIGGVRDSHCVKCNACSEWELAD